MFLDHRPPPGLTQGPALLTYCGNLVPRRLVSYELWVLTDNEIEVAAPNCTNWQWTQGVEKHEATRFYAALLD